MAETEQELATRLGSAIRRARTSRRWSQATLAERGERLPSFAVVIQIAELFETTTVALLGEPAEDPWLTEMLELLRAVPTASRAIVTGMLRGAVASAAAEPEAEVAASRPRRGRRREH